MPTRRSLLQSAAALAPALLVRSAAAQTGGAATASAGKGRIPLGFDNFSIRAAGWKAGRIVEYAGAQKVDCLLLSDLDVYESHDESYLKDLGKKARDLGVTLYAGTGGICPSAFRFSNKWGTADEHLALSIRVAKAVGSPVLRCYQGFGEDRKSPGGIPARQQDTVKVCQAAKSRAVDAGVKIAIENHAGDMQSWELKELVEACGKDFVGVTIDCGNATWTLEDPMVNLEVLAPYVLSSGMRDSMIWNDADGVQVQWTAIGEGNMDMKSYGKRYGELCPGAPFILEIISGFARSYPWRKPEFWDAYQRVRPAEFARFLNLSQTGKPLPSWQPAAGEDRKVAEPAYQMAELERSLAYCRATLGMGLRS
ncbi:MAG: Xylose isomerase-like barrel [Verrucomicrobiales bacterium]|nr:Xylose isomerase-like barrel [Verrucomicrobiales bacterium]